LIITFLFRSETKQGCAPGELATHWVKEQMPPTASIGNWNKWMSDVENGTITLNSSNEKPDPVVKKTRRKQQTSKPESKFPPLSSIYRKEKTFHCSIQEEVLGVHPTR